MMTFQAASLINLYDDSQFACTAHFSQEQSCNSGILYSFYNPGSQCLLVPCNPHYVFLCFRVILYLYQSQNNMKLVHKFMCVGPESFYYLINASQLLCYL